MHFLSKTIKSFKLNICIVVKWVYCGYRFNRGTTVDMFNNSTAGELNKLNLFFNLTHLCYLTFDNHIFWKYSGIRAKYNVHKSLLCVKTKKLRFS